MEARKVQRLGTTSLVVTLPRDWVKRNGLKPGDLVYIMEEGEGLRIELPEAVKKAKRQEVVKLNADKLPDPLIAGKLTSCFYILGIEDAIVESEKGPLPSELISALRRSASRLSGVEVVEDAPSRVYVKTLLDISRISPTSILRQLVIAITKLTDLLVEVIEGKGVNQQEFMELGAEVFRLQHLVIKHLISASLSKTRDENQRKMNSAYMIAASLIGLLGDYISKMALELMRAGEFYKLTPRDKEIIEDLLRSLRDLGNSTISGLVSSSTKRILECFKGISDMKAKLQEAKRVASPEAMYFISKIEDCLRIVEIVDNTAICTSLLVKSPWIERVEQS